MDREILFRGKRVDDGVWVCGDLTTMGSSPASIFEGVDVDYPVDPATVGQFTGMKDKNGVMVFEGDIVRYCDTMGEFVGIIEYTPTMFYMNLGGWKPLLQGHRGITNCEVLGNRWDNPEMAKEAHV